MTVIPVHEVKCPSSTKTLVQPTLAMSIITLSMFWLLQMGYVPILSLAYMKAA